MQIKIKILENGKGLELPAYATAGSAGMDLRAAIMESFTLKKQERKLIPTGFSIAIADGYHAEIRSRSGLSLKNGISVLNSPGTIDSDYRGEVMALLINLGDDDFVVDRGMRIAQMVIMKHETVFVEEVDCLDHTVRANRGYGSTGLK